MVGTTTGIQMALLAKFIAISLTTQFAVAVVNLNCGISHESGLSAIKEAIDNRERNFFPAGDIPKIFEFVLKNKYFKLGGKFLQQS